MKKQEYYKCPGEFHKECGKVVIGFPYKGQADIIQLEKHEGCRRRWIHPDEGRTNE